MFKKTKEMKQSLIKLILSGNLNMETYLYFINFYDMKYIQGFRELTYLRKDLQEIRRQWWKNQSTTSRVNIATVYTIYMDFLDEFYLSIDSKETKMWRQIISYQKRTMKK